MSIEIYVQGFSGGQPDGIGTREVLAAFGTALVPGPGDRYRLVYDAENDCEVAVTEEAGRAMSLCLFRPCDHPGLWQSLFALLTQGPYVLYAPGGEAPVAVRPDVSGALPEGMSDALGSPVLAEGPGDIRNAVIGPESGF